MTRIKLKNVDRFTDRHGKVRYFYRVGRGPRLAKLPGQPGSPEFMLAYEAAARGEHQPNAEQRRERGEPGTFDRLVQDYLSSPDFKRLAQSTQRAYRLVIERLVHDEGIGHRLVREMKREHINRIVSKRSATPGAANDVLKKLKILIHFAIDAGWRSDDPTLRIKKFESGEFHTWTDEEIAAFETHWPVGTTARLAMALLLYTGQRRSDVVTMLWGDVQDGAIRVVQRKTGAKLWIAIHPELERILADVPRRGATILTTSFGKAFAAAGFGNYMADKIAEAGLPDQCVTHGLRKAASRRLAEAGCSANEIAAITGHVTLAEVSRYTKAAEQRLLARTAIRRLSADIEIPNRGQEVGSRGNNPNDSKGSPDDWRARKDSNL